MPLLYFLTNLKRHLAVLRQLIQHLTDERLDGHLAYLWTQAITMHNVNQLLDRNTALPARDVHMCQCLQHLILSPFFGLQLSSNLLVEIRNDHTMCRISSLATLRLHNSQRVHSNAELLTCRGVVSQDVVAGEHGHLFREHDASVVLCMAGCVHRSESSAFDLKDSPVEYGLLTLVGSVFEDGITQVRIHAQEIRYASSVVAMPVRG